MNEQESADRFSQDVDEILRGQRPPAHDDSKSAEYHRSVDLAHLLAAADFSREGRIREALRSRLLGGIDAGELRLLRRQQRKEILMRTIRNYVWKPLPAVTLAAMVLGAVLFPLVWPGALPAAAQNIDRFVREVVVGEHTTVRQVTPAERAAQAKGTVPELPENMWYVQTPIGGFGGDVLEGEDPTVRYYHTFELAQQRLPDVDLREPTDLPPGYLLRGALVTPPDGVILTYSHFRGQGSDIVLVEKAVDEQRRVSVGSGAPVKEVIVNGRRGAWTDGQYRRSLHWEAQGISYTVGGIGMSLDEAIRIAESLE